MADPQDRALGTAIRRRRKAVGLQQREIADRLGLAPVVYGRIELGNRPVKALELRDIAQILGTDIDTLLRDVSPVTPEELVDRAATRRDAAYSALFDYGSSVLDAMAAVEDSESGALMDDTWDMRTAADVTEYLIQSQKNFIGLRSPANAVKPLRHALTAVAESLSVTPTEGADD